MGTELRATRGAELDLAPVKGDMRLYPKYKPGLRTRQNEWEAFLSALTHGIKGEVNRAAEMRIDF